MYNSNRNKNGRLTGLSGITKAAAPAIILAALAAWGVFSASAGKPAQKTVRADFINSPLVTDPVYDAAGNPAVAGDTLVYGDNSGFCDHRYPITAPDGRQVTLAEWRGANGTAQVTCVRQGTHVVLDLTGLIPGGVYTIWIAVFQAPGITPDFANIIGVGALGAPDGSQNAFVASAEGKATVSAITPPGNLSEFGSVGCLLDEFEVHFWVGLHLDGQTHGPSPGDPCQIAFPGGFLFKKVMSKLLDLPESKRTLAESGAQFEGSVAIRGQAELP